MYRPNFSKDVLMSYVLDIEEELNDKSPNIETILGMIQVLKIYIKEG